MSQRHAKSFKSNKRTVDYSVLLSFKTDKIDHISFGNILVSHAMPDQTLSSYFISSSIFSVYEHQVVGNFIRESIFLGGCLLDMMVK